VIEAMALGKCVVAANTAAVPEQISNFQSGFIVPQRDSRALSNMIQFLIHNKELIEKIGKAASEEVRVNFPLEKMINEQFSELQLAEQSYRLNL
jgi:glycosyltransferase involved in cell wall biosynthesis